MEGKEYYKLEDIKKTTIKLDFIVCPSCNEIHESLTGIDSEFYIRESKRNIWTLDLIRLREMVNEKGTLFCCDACGFIFDKNIKNWNSKAVEVMAYICPKCNQIVSKTPSNFASGDVGYMCPHCSIFLAYYKPQRHGSGNVDVKKTTDYFHGICPNCKNEENYGMMFLRGEIILGHSHGVRGRLILPLKCQNCGYEDTIKIGTPDHNPIKLEFE